MTTDNNQIDNFEQLDPRQYILIKGARVHNLKNINVAIPRNKLVVVTGLSGSGKSSLAFDTLFAEGQRMYVESLNSYARQFLGRMGKPDVDYIVFDYLTDTYTSLLSKITSKGYSISDIALVQHANIVNGFQIIANEAICNSNEDAPFPSFDTLRSFLSNLKNQVGLEIFDFLACSLYDSEKMPLIFQILEQDLPDNWWHQGHRSRDGTQTREGAGHGHNVLQ